LNTIQVETTQASPAAAQSGISCSKPAGFAERAYCQRLERKILRYTVRIEMHTWVTVQGQQKKATTQSHATILDGQYLVTHNHYRYSLTEQVELFGDEIGYTAISLWSGNGALLLSEAHLSSFNIVYEDTETLVLAFLKKNGRGLFEAAGLPSAPFASHASLRLQAGEELAQIVWNGKSTRVDWARVERVGLRERVPHFQVNNYPIIGCSGGGVFLNGVHIGNNWGRDTEQDPDTGLITWRYSVIALNSAGLLNLDR
jgi:hypothetical protein